MQALEAVGREPNVEFSIPADCTRKMEDVLSCYLPRFYRNAYRYLGNMADAEDAVQDALLAAYKHMHQFKGEAQLSTWLSAIVTNSARMQLRKRLRHPQVSLDEPIGQEQQYCLSAVLADIALSPEDECRNSELRRQLLESVAQLSPPLRRAFELRELNGRSVREAAQALGLPEGTVKAQLSRARAKLSRMMRRVLAPTTHTSRRSLTGRRRSEQIPGAASEPRIARRRKNSLCLGHVGD